MKYRDLGDARDELTREGKVAKVFPNLLNGHGDNSRSEGASSHGEVGASNILREEWLILWYLRYL